MAVWYGTDRNIAHVITNVTKSLERITHRPPTYRAVLALHAGAVEAEGRHAVADPLDVEDALVAPLARLRLGQVPGLQGDGLHLTCWDQNLLRAHQLGTVLEKKQTRRAGSTRQRRQTGKQKKNGAFFFFPPLFRSPARREAGREEVRVQGRTNYLKNLKVTPVTLESRECSTTHYHGWNCEAARLVKRMTKKRAPRFAV